MSIKEQLAQFGIPSPINDDGSPTGAKPNTPEVPELSADPILPGTVPELQQVLQEIGSKYGMACAALLEVATRSECATSRQFATSVLAELGVVIVDNTTGESGEKPTIQ